MTARFEPPSPDKSDRRGKAFALIALTASIIAIAIFYLKSSFTIDPQLIVAFLGIMSAVGVFFLFALSTGLLSFIHRDEEDPALQLVADQSSNALLVTLGISDIIYVNSAYLILAGARDPSDAPSLEKLFSGPPEASEALYRLAQAARSWTSHIEEIRRTPALINGQSVGWYRIQVKPITYRSNRACLWEISDLTEERRRQEAVFEGLSHGVNLFNHAPVGFFSSEANGKILCLNDTLLSWVDIDKKQIEQGQSDLTSLLVNETAALVNLRGEPGQKLIVEIGCDLRGREGKSRPVHILHQVICRRDGTAAPSHSIVIDRSVSDAENDAFRAAEVWFTRFYNSTPMAIAILDVHGQLLEANLSFARLFPKAFDSTQDRYPGPWSALKDLSEDEATSLRAALEAAIAGGAPSEPIDIEYEIDGSRHGARCFVAPGDREQAEGAIFYALDITDQKRLQEEFAQSQKLNDVGRIAGIVAHDFNNILTPILGWSDLLLSTHRPTDPAFKDIHQIKSMTLRAAALTRQLLAFSRRQNLNPQVFNVGDMLSEFQFLLRKLVDEKTEISLHHGRDLGLVKADRVQLEQVMIDLVANARDALPTKGGKIQIRTKRINPGDCAVYHHPTLPPNDYVLIEVEDNGCGIPEEIKEKIFDPFFTTKSVGAGAGLGLSSALGVVQQSNGYILYDSIVDRGSVFRIFLPQHTIAVFPDDEPPAEPPSINPVPRPAGNEPSTGSILLVDDDDAVRSFAAHALRKAGFVVHESINGQDALDVMTQLSGNIDVVISDVEMPDLDGPSMAAQILSKNPGVKVIFMSGYTEEDLKAAQPELDFLFLEKPFENRRIIETVKEALASK